MKKIVKPYLAILATLVLSFVTSNLHAQSSTDDDIDKGFYLQGGVASLKYTYGTYSYNLGTTYAVYGGYNFNKYIAAEILSATAHSTSNYSTTLNFNGYFLKPKYPLNDNLELFGRIGSNTISVNTSYAGSRSISSASYGGGLTAYLSADKTNYISAEYMTWYSRSGETLSGISVAYGRKF
jgi:hypothetical protein